MLVIISILFQLIYYLNLFTRHKIRSVNYIGKFCTKKINNYLTEKRINNKYSLYLPMG